MEFWSELTRIGIWTSIKTSGSDSKRIKPDPTVKKKPVSEPDPTMEKKKSPEPNKSYPSLFYIQVFIINVNKINLILINYFGQQILKTKSDFRKILNPAIQTGSDLFPNTDPDPQPCLNVKMTVANQRIICSHKPSLKPLITII